MRNILIGAALAAIACPALAQAEPAAPATTQPAAEPAAAKATKLSTGETLIGDLLDNETAKVILDKHLPGFTTNPQISMARGMTLKAIQQFSPADVTDERLAAIDADLAKLSK